MTQAEQDRINFDALRCPWCTAGASGSHLLVRRAGMNTDCPNVGKPRTDWTTPFNISNRPLFHVLKLVGLDDDSMGSGFFFDMTLLGQFATLDEALFHADRLIAVRGPATAETGDIEVHLIANLQRSEPEAPRRLRMQLVDDLVNAALNNTPYAGQEREVLEREIGNSVYEGDWRFAYALLVRFGMTADRALGTLGCWAKVLS